MYEIEAVRFYKALKNEALNNIGPWKHSPVQAPMIDCFEKYFDVHNILNFRRTPISMGLLNFPDIPLAGGENPWFEGLTFKEKLIGLISLLYMLNKLKSRLKVKLSDISDNAVGNPCCVRFGKYYLTEVAMRSYYYERQIRKINNVKNILELGGGFGHQCLKIFSSPELNIKNYYLVDLPESLALSFYYLKNNSCNVQAVISENNLIRQDSGKQIILISPWMMAKCPPDVDLFINIMSFQHMSYENLIYYFSIIEDLKITYLYLVNRNLKRDPTDIEMSKYPIPGGYELISQEKWPFGKQVVVRNKWLFFEQIPGDHLECLFKLFR